MFSESDTLELKSELTADIKKEAVAFANTKGGTIYIGISDSGEVLGVDNGQKKCEQLSSMLHDGIKPDITILTEISLEKIDGKAVIKVSVQPGTKQPYYLSDKGLKPCGVYIRLGNTSIPATETAIRNMISETDGKRFELIRSLDQDLTFEATEKEFKNKNLELGIQQKRTLGITDNDGIYTNLGLLLSDQCRHTIKVAVFSGSEKEEFITRREFTGSLFKQLEDSYSFIELNNNLRSTFEGLKRIDSLDYPKEAIREALLNAVVHRDYSFSGSILISIFTDRIEFVSLGGLVPGLEAEDIYTGISQPRNEKLANIFYRLEYIEAYGTGIHKIQRACMDYGVKAEFKITNAAFKVTIPNRSHCKYRSDVKANGANELYDNVLKYIAQNPYSARKQIQEKFNLKQTMCISILKGLEQQALIQRVGKGKNTVYITT